MGAAIYELGRAIKQRRTEMGLTQATLARLSGLSRSTVNQVENCTITDLSVSRAERLLGVVGLVLQIPLTRRSGLPKPRTSPLELAARTSSVSMSRTIPAEEVSEALVSGAVAKEWRSHLRTLLEEAPVSLLADVVQELHERKGIDRPEVWTRMRVLANGLQCNRELWSE